MPAEARSASHSDPTRSSTSSVCGRDGRRLPRQGHAAGEKRRRQSLARRVRIGPGTHIAAVFDVGESSGMHYMVQEHLEGQTLGDRLQSKGAMSTKAALDLAIEIVEALAAAHGAGIVHRDLKPPNIFVSSDGHAKVLDFGLAKLTEFTGIGGSVDSRSPTMVGTVAGQVMGTAGYMAPEQVEGEAVDHRADVFAFGCVLCSARACGSTATNRCSRCRRTAPWCINPGSAAATQIP